MVVVRGSVEFRALMRRGLDKVSGERRCLEKGCDDECCEKGSGEVF